DRTLDDVLQTAAGFFDQRADIVDTLLRLRARVADREAALAIGADATNEHEVASDGGLGERQRTFVNAIRPDDALGHKLSTLFQGRASDVFAAGAHRQPLFGCGCRRSLPYKEPVVGTRQAEIFTQGLAFV